jgi:hypothetical protein
VHIETDAAPDLEPPRVVDGRTLVKAGLRPPPPAAIGLDKGPAIDKSRCREIEGQERAASLTPVRPTTKRDAKPLFAKEKMIAQVRSAIRLRDSGKGKRLTRLTGEQNQKERTFDVLPKPANLISYRQVHRAPTPPRSRFARRARKLAGIRGFTGERIGRSRARGSIFSSRSGSVR